MKSAPRQISVLRSTMLGIAMLGLLTACTSDTKEVEAWVQEVKARPAPPLDPLPVMRQVSVSGASGAKNSAYSLMPPSNRND